MAHRLSACASDTCFCSSFDLRACAIRRVAAAELKSACWCGRRRGRRCAVQLADFLAPRVERAGGMMTLPDVYCLFNRARGAELVSPDDLLAAVQARGMRQMRAGSAWPAACHAGYLSVKRI